LGEIAALLTAFCWSFNSLFYSLAGKKVGSYTVNFIRLLWALPMLLIINMLVYHKFFPTNLSGKEYFWLALSGFIGYILGDACLYEALILLGARLTMLVMTTTPIFSAIIAWIFLKESLSILQISGILITIAGIAYVVLNEPKKEGEHKKKNLWGIIFALGGALGQATGLLFSKFGMIGGTSPISANIIRISAGFLVMLLITLIKGKFITELAKLKDGKASNLIFWGTFTGPVIGVILALYSINHTHMGIASTLMSLSPLLLIPISHFLFHEKITTKVIFGTIFSIIGASILFFV